MSNIREITRAKWSLVALLLGQTYLIGCEDPPGVEIEDEDERARAAVDEPASADDIEIQPVDALADESPFDVTFDNTAAAWVPVTYYYIRAKHSKKCLHQHGGVLDNGAPITQWDCVDQENVQWRIEPSPTKGYYYIKARHSDKCAHQHGGTYGDGDPITQWECVNQGNVKWKIVSAGKGYYYIKAQHSGKCMHVHGGGSGNGDPITQWSCINQPNVQWTFKPVGH